jgi:2-dehydro-3-deoxyphosphogluconate aldolase/(4S)-4-hydroxy-2-oxoglutarate aldolase
MTPTKPETLARLLTSGIVAVIRAQSKDQLEPLAIALIAGGVLGIEVTMTTPNALAGIEHLASTLGDRAIVGVGTVLDAQTARDAIAAGAQFVVSPVLDQHVIETTLKHGKISIPGAFTPTEIHRATTLGADVVKVFPSTSLGPTYFKDLLAPMPHLRLTPTGGVDLKNAADWIKAGAACLGVGSSLISKDALTKGNWPTITATAKAFVEAVAGARAKA